MNKRGIEKLMYLYFFVLLVLVMVAIIYIVNIYYGAPYNVQSTESSILEDQIGNCLLHQNYIVSSDLNNTFRENFLKYCHLNFSVENVYGWTNSSEYYAEVNVYKYDQGAFGSVGTSIFNVTVGNVNLKNIWQLYSTMPSSSPLTPLRKVNTIVIHSTEGSTTSGALETIGSEQLSIHYLIDTTGQIYSQQDPYYEYQNAFKSPNEVAAHAGCGVGADKIQTCSSSCIDSNGNGMLGVLDPKCQQLTGTLPKSQWCCIPNYNINSIGIELVNLGSRCSTDAKGSSYCKNSEAFDGKQWQPFSNAQMNSLVNLVSGLAAVYNIPLDRNHIIGHYQITTNKTDPGPAFNWTQFMSLLQAKGAVAPPTSTSSSGQVQRSFYALDKDGNQYVVTVLGLVGKNEKNIASQ